MLTEDKGRASWGGARQVTQYVDERGASMTLDYDIGFCSHLPILFLKKWLHVSISKLAFQRKGLSSFWNEGISKELYRNFT